MPPSQQDNSVKNHVNIFAYYGKRNQKVAAINLLFNGYRIFKGATIVRNFDVYKNMPSGPDSPPDIATVTSLMVSENFTQIKRDIANLINTEIERILDTPGLEHI